MEKAFYSIALMLALAACGSSQSSTVRSEHIAKSAFSGDWPISVDAGTISCDLSVGGGAITFTPDGSSTVYAVNGTAMNWETDKGWKDFHEIWLDNPDPVMAAISPKVNSSAFDAVGHKLGDEAKPSS